MSEPKNFFVWFVTEGEEGGKTLKLYEPKGAAEVFVGEKMSGGWTPDEEAVEVDVRDPEGTVHHFDVEIVISITAERRTGLYGSETITDEATDPMIRMDRRVCHHCSSVAPYILQCEGVLEYIIRTKWVSPTSQSHTLTCPNCLLSVLSQLQSEAVKEALRVLGVIRDLCLARTPSRDWWSKMFDAAVTRAQEVSAPKSNCQ